MNTALSAHTDISRFHGRGQQASSAPQSPEQAKSAGVSALQAGTDWEDIYLQGVVCAARRLGPLVAINRGWLLSLGADFIGADAIESQRLAKQYVENAPRCKAEYSSCDITIDTPIRTPVLTLVGPLVANP